MGQIEMVEKEERQDNRQQSEMKNNRGASQAHNTTAAR